MAATSNLTATAASAAPTALRTSAPPSPTFISLRPISRCSRLHSVKTKATEKGQGGKKPVKAYSLVCADCEGNGAIACGQCKGSGVNSEDHFNGRFKEGAMCWLCRGKREVLCGSCNGAGFLGGFMSTADDTSE
ncbi:uncharacterized protein LOC100836490 [Brachypodium distachyon]|uniref:BSD2 cysteine rich domain-containing protein n=1 Tax=Brachypodium distachyon TaxID=15368 RepID=I1H447_BRADI|nr:uncharacterized protein LOC100836490 [Brachypodium distachyon]KQK21079.1 hypothetical protein BRADI_1g58600v3 [Brachypodium distachyon]|eukprot:XP_003557655.1 uncharacterized protein LOC100836490 [Brachypodium distachyon]